MESFILGGETRERMELAVRGYEIDNPCSPYDDGLAAEVIVDTGAFHVRYRARFLFMELSNFSEQLARLNETLRGTAVLETLEHQLHLEVSADVLGHIRVRGEARENPAHWTRLLFELSLDQTHLTSAVRSLQLLLRTFPSRM